MTFTNWRKKDVSPYSNEWQAIPAQTSFKMAVSISAMPHLFETKIQEKNLESATEYGDKIPKVLVGDPVLHLENVCPQSCEELEEEFNSINNTNS